MVKNAYFGELNILILGNIFESYFFNNFFLDVKKYFWENVAKYRYLP